MSFHPIKEHEAGYVDLAAVIAALAAMTKTDIARLLAYTRKNFYYVQLYVPEMGPEDLVIEAMLRTRLGKRRWKQGTDLQAHLMGCIKGIASDEYKKYRIRPNWQDWNSEQHLAENEASNEYAAYREKKLFQALAGDVLATQVLESRLEGRKPAQTCAELGITAAAYEAARRRIKRAWERIKNDV